MEFKGFDDWIEIFKGGMQVDSQGREQDGDRLIDRAVATFSVDAHEPPAVIGHPTGDAPAWAWVEALKEKTENGTRVLMAKFKDVVPEFEDMVKKGMFKKRSAAFYPDGRLHHVGFLGAAPPAVKGLADLKFAAAAEAVCFEYDGPERYRPGRYWPGQGPVGRIFRNLRDWFIEKEGRERADAIIPDWDVDYIKELPQQDNTEESFMPGFKEKIKGVLTAMGIDASKVPDDALPDAPPEGGMKAFSEADVSAAVEQARQAGRKEAQAEFAEAGRKARRKAQEAEIAAFCDGQIKAGKLLPAWMRMGLKEFMLKLDGEEVVEFAEGNKVSAMAWFKDFLAELPKAVEFKEIATRDADMGTGGAGAKLNEIAWKKMKDGNMDYSTAFSQAQVEYPDLAREYAGTRQ